MQRNILIVLGCIAVIVAVAFLARGGFLLNHATTGTDTAATSSPDQLSDAQVQEILGRVGKHILLASDETPIIATVKDADSLRTQQPFYQDVQSGDYLIVYQKQLRAILYDPNKDILVNVGAIQQPPKETPAATSTAPSTSQ